MKHLTIGGSTFSRTLACPGWIKASENLPKGPTGPAAISGSMHHMVQELCQGPDSKYQKPEDCLGLIYREGHAEREFRDSDLDTAEIVFIHTNRLMDDLGIDEFILEPFVQLIENEAGGSIDVLGKSKDNRTVLVLDYKTGKIKVSPVENDQLLFYALSAYLDPVTSDLFDNVDKVVLAVVQPSAKNVVSRWDCDMTYLADYHQKAKEVIKKTKLKNPPLNPGSHCQWCPAAPYCKARKADVIATKGLQPLDKKQLQASADILEEVEAWVNATKKELFVQITRGASITGWKIIDKQGKRQWIDRDRVEKALLSAKIDKALFTKTSILTAPQTVAALKKAKIEFELDEYIEFKSSGTTLAPEHADGDAVQTGGVPDNLKKLVGKK